MKVPEGEKRDKETEIISSGNNGQICMKYWWETSKKLNKFQVR